MKNLSLIIVVLSVAFILYQFTESPHGSDLNVGCEVCHSPDSWKLDMAIYSFDHSSTRLPLEGAHTELNCRLCHESLVFSEAANECSECHIDIHNNSLGLECARCHNAHSWLVNNIRDIHQMSRFPLFGAHAMADCEDCHQSQNFTTFEPLGIECFDCHSEEYMATNTPNHTLANYSHDCSECHNIFAYEWGASGFSHAFFPLTQGHMVHDCAECHTSMDYNNTSTECFSCHEADYNSTTKPGHSFVGISNSCDECHTTSPGWTPAQFPDHSDYYLLKGAHMTIASSCYECHNETFSNTPNTCFGCHVNEYNESLEPNHVEAQIETECLNCHGEVTWKPAMFDHDEIFVLAGAHTVISSACILCHQTGYVNTLNTCYGCHEADFTEALVPNHVTAQFETECTDCHNEIAWIPSTFDHNQIFALAGAHALISGSCLECHEAGYQNTPNTCFGCHESDFNEAGDPNHVTSQFETECTVCHSETAWSPALFNHNNIYPLTGAHAGIANNCNECHANGYVNTPNTCYECHTQDYNNTNDPPHVATQFNTDCEACHTTFAWEPATFNHDDDYFPIYRGEHDEEWNSCTDCHTTPGNYAIFSCIDCHEHNQIDMDDDHDDVTDYSYNTEACFACHPTGEAR
jgi:hypothetical protein